MLLSRRLLVLLGCTFLTLGLAWNLLFRNGMDKAPSFVQGLHDKIDPPKPPPPKPTPKYKPLSDTKALPIVDNFPLAAAAHSAAELPPIPRWNKLPTPHPEEKTPLFIGFTRNWRLLQQVVVAYITSGWPPEDIYVVENTGVMDANRLGQLSLQNPFFLNHTRLEMFGVNVLITPTLLTFAQLQNFYIWTATEKNWPIYFWSHMDIAAISYESGYVEERPKLDTSAPDLQFDDFRSIYDFCVAALTEVLQAKDEKTGKTLRWAMRLFSYDRLALVNVASFKEIGGWDTQIPFYTTDCDMHERIAMAGLSIQDKPAGFIFDVASSVDDLIVFYRKRKRPDGTPIPAVTFQDPNAINDALHAIKEGEETLKKAGYPIDDDGASPEKEVKPTKRDGEEQNIRRSPLPDEEAKPETPAEPPASSQWEDDTVSSPLFHSIIKTLEAMQHSKATNDRFVWQKRQTGGQGEPFYRDPTGFDKAIQMTIDHGRNVFNEKWGHRGCDLIAQGLRPEDAWRVEHDWD